MRLKILLLFGLIIVLAGSCTIIELALQGESGETEQAGSADAPEIVEGTVAEISTNFTNMVNRARGMRASRIRGMSSGEVASLGAPILSAVIHSKAYSAETFERLADPSSALSRNPRNISEANHRTQSRRIIQASTSDESENIKLSTEDIKQILLNFNENNLSEVCSELFNMRGNQVWLSPGENLNVANLSCPAGTTFFILEGTHTGQMIESSKDGNSWIGVGTAVLDGEKSRERAFSGGLNNNTITHLQIQNYTDHGIYSTRSVHTNIRYTEFRNIATDKHGQEFGAVMFHNSENILVRDSYIENAASGIRFRDSNGPLVVSGNRALNSGRNFFQCDKCNGTGIRINRNSMEHTEQTGRAPLEDWINLYMSNGTADDPIQVNNNRARGHSESNSGSFIMLADATGSYQEAIGNIGVDPGQVGIGIASGTHIKVEGNMMYSRQWPASNVAYYSAEYSSPCGNHQFIENTNVAHWRNSDGTLNRAWSDGNCGVTNGEIRALIREDRTMGPEIWNRW